VGFYGLSWCLEAVVFEFGVCVGGLFVSLWWPPPPFVGVGLLDWGGHYSGAGRVGGRVRNRRGCENGGFVREKSGGGKVRLVAENPGWD